MNTRRTHQTAALLTPFRINTCKSVSKQMTSTPFRISTCEKRGEGRAWLISSRSAGTPPAASQHANPFTSSTSSISFPSNLLRTLERSCRSFPSSRPLFSMFCRLFLQNTGGVGVATVRSPDQNREPRGAARVGGTHAASGMVYWSRETAAICLLAGLALRRRAAITLSSAGTK